MSNGVIPTIKKLTRVTRKAATANTMSKHDHILTNTFVNSIFKLDTSDHFSSDFSNSISQLIKRRSNWCIYKRFVTDEAIAAFNISLYRKSWKESLEFENVN